jgi:ATP-binding cassette, subfamily B, bacterial CvaB/MchF/RaxB
MCHKGEGRSCRGYSDARSEKGLSNNLIDFHGVARRRISLVRQTEVAECGLACIAMIAGYYGARYDTASMRRSFEPSLRGATLKSLIAVADRVGLAARAVRCEPEALADLTLPCVLHWKMTHYVVLERVEKRGYFIHDPEGESRWFSDTDVSRSFTGIALELTPTNDFEQGDRRKLLKLHQLWGRMTGLKRSLIQIFVLSFIVQIFLLITPLFLQFSVDSLLPSGDLWMLAALTVAFSILAIINGSASFLKDVVALRASSTIGFGISSNVARRMTRLPVDWFTKRHVGDVTARFLSVNPIKDGITNVTVTLFFDIIILIAVAVIMFTYSGYLATIAIAAVLLYSIVKWATYAELKSNEEEVIDTKAKEQTVLIETLRGIATLRLYSSETGRHHQWRQRLAEATNSTFRLARLRSLQKAISAGISGVENVLTIYLGVRAVLSETMSVGMLFAFLSYKAIFVAKSVSVVDQVNSLSMFSLHLERLSDIALADEDPCFVAQPTASSDLRGSIELRGVSFRYSENDPLVLDNVSMKIEPGEHVAITGPSGCGKSTLVKILLGLAFPTSGDVIVDGLPLVRFGILNYRRQIGAVLQDDTLFAGSIAGNIALFDEVYELDRIASAASGAAIAEDIEAMPMRYDTLVGDMGSALSGGQRQRILLARALYRDPKVLIIDEGTSHLDSARERIVNRYISDQGITRIIVAHRKETIEAADRVVIMQNGRIL